MSEWVSERFRNVDQKGVGVQGPPACGVDQKGGGFRVPPKSQMSEVEWSGVWSVGDARGDKQVVSE